MTSLDRIRIPLLAFAMVAFSLISASAVQGQTVLDQEEQLLEESFALDPDALLGDDDKGERELSRLVDKSTISDLEFLNAGVAPSTVEQLKAMQEHVAALYERVEPAVVNIQSGMGQGSGVVITKDGYILTAAHVISVPNRTAIITFPDGSRAKAQTLGLFRTLDAGLLKIFEVLPDLDVDEEEDEEPEMESEEGSENSESEKEDKMPEPSEDSGESDGEGDSDDETESKEEGDSESDDSDVEESKGDEPESEQADEEESDEEESDKEESDKEESDKEESDGDPEEGENSEEDKGADSKSEEDEDNGRAVLEQRRKRLAERFKIQDDLPSFNYLEIGDSAGLNLGQWVIAVGHPGGLDEARGIVLRVGRINEIEAEADDAYVQTDCSLVGGDSGGPLIGMDGSVIGIHSRIGRRLKMNFHVPSNEYLNNWTDLLVPVVHDVDADLGITFRGKTNVIDEVPIPSLAARSGLKSSDRIIRIGDKEVYDKLQFDDAVSNLKPYQRVEFEIQRRGKKRVLDVIIGERREGQ